MSHEQDYAGRRATKGPLIWATDSTVRSRSSGSTRPSGRRRPGLSQFNKSLGLTRAHHLVLGYDHALTPTARLKLEAFGQSLFEVPVAADSSYSMLNFSQDWAFDVPLVNTGAGRNYGLELTLDRFLDNGFYGLFTGSVFRSRYRGGDGVWRNTRWDRGYTLTALAGKEFSHASGNHLGFNARFELTGGMRRAPYDRAASQAAREVVYDELRAFSVSDPAVYSLDFTVTYRRNHRNYAGIWALQVKNALTSGIVMPDYNYRLRDVEDVNERIMIPVLSYKIEF